MRPTSTPHPFRPSLKNTVKVWDLPVRVSHWGLALSFAVTYWSGDEWRPVHTAAGYAALALISFRIVWGFTGSKYARFSQFVAAPAVVAGHVRDIVNGREVRYVGHNPAGAVMIAVMLLLTLAACITGVLLTTDTYWGSETMDNIHGTIATTLLVCVGLHIAGVIMTSLRTRENLATSMISGNKRAPGEGDIG